MRNKISYSLIVFIFSLSANCQNNAFKINPIAFFYNGFEISYERKSQKKSSVELIISHTKTRQKNLEGDLIMNAFELKYKFLLSEKTESIEGWYIAPTGSLSRGKVKFDLQNKNPNDIVVNSIGAIGGYQFLFKNKKSNGFLLDLYFGANNNFVKSLNLDISEIKGLKLRYGISVGYGF